MCATFMLNDLTARYWSFQTSWLILSIYFRLFCSQSGVRVFPEAVSLLVASFLHPTDSDRSTKLLRPYLASGVMAPRDYAKCSVDGARSIPRLIPDTADMPDLNDSTPTETRSIKDLAHFTEGERKALEAARRSAQKLPLWMRTPGLPHPNEVFFYKVSLHDHQSWSWNLPHQHSTLLISPMVSFRFFRAVPWRSSLFRWVTYVLSLYFSPYVFSAPLHMRHLVKRLDLKNSSFCQPWWADSRCSSSFQTKGRTPQVSSWFGDRSTWSILLC